MSDNSQGKFQALLTTGLAIALGATLMTVVGSNDATAYPSGAVSFGANPVWSVGGNVSTSSDLLVTAPSGQTAVLSDVVLTMYQNSDQCEISITNGAGDNLGEFRLHSYMIDTHNSWGNARSSATQPVSIQHTYSSGISIDGGDSLYLTETGACGVSYSISGYYAEP
jgi:hypothetical protein